MKFGYFDDTRREYVITTPETPLPWINYLGSDSFFTLISNTCGGYSFYKDARLLRLTRYRYNDVPADMNGQYLYIRDGETVWNPGWKPVRTDLDSYECRHGMGYSRFSAQKNGVSASVLFFVPVHDTCEIQYLTIRNDTDAEKVLQLFSYVEWCLWDANDDMTNYQRNLNTGEVEVVCGEKDSVLYHKTEYRERRSHYAFYSVNAPADGYDTSRDAFLGPDRGADHPAAVEQGRCTDSIAHGWAPAAIHQLNLTLQAGEERTFIYLLGYAENPDDNKWESPGVIRKAPAREMVNRYASDNAVLNAFEELRSYWDGLLSRYTVQSENDNVNRMVNIWNQYQCMVTFNMSRSASYYESGVGRGMGFRDSCQDLLGFVHLIPERARERILDIASTQFRDGSACHQYQPLTKKGNADIGNGFNDDPLWLIAGTGAYIRETGDFSILDEPVVFESTPGTEAPLMEHLRRSFDFTVCHKGPHGLPLIGRADWNDCLNLNCFSYHPGESFQTLGSGDGPVAESIFIAAMFVKYGQEYAELCRLTSRSEEAQRAQKEVAAVYDAVIENGWDGEWYLRAYDAAGNKVGSRECEEGRIFIETQGFCPLAGIGVKEGLAEKALDSVKKYLDTQYGIVLLQPAYSRYYPELGEISSYPPGYKENAGIFCHNNPWVSAAETMIGRGDRAFEIYRKTCPSYVEEFSEIHRTEPYIYSQMVAGIDAPTFGEAKNSWLTGTAAWTFVNISQYILGVMPTYEGLSINPCVPKDFGSYTITRCYRGAVYHIQVENPDHVEKGIRELFVDGVLTEGIVIPYVEGKTSYDVRAVMG